MGKDIFVLDGDIIKALEKHLRQHEDPWIRMHRSAIWSKSCGNASQGEIRAKHDLKYDSYQREGMLLEILLSWFELMPMTANS